ncbi:MAG: hypothetical protein QM652_02885 [Legionella sp.]|uniref:hypothetical protein n=1 Tax=Legionella sp. TaxID=459 RepID=UPI0039E529A7
MPISAKEKVKEEKPEQPTEPEKIKSDGKQEELPQASLEDLQKEQQEKYEGYKGLRQQFNAEITKGASKDLMDIANAAEAAYQDAREKIIDLYRVKIAVANKEDDDAKKNKTFDPNKSTHAAIIAENDKLLKELEQMRSEDLAKMQACLKDEKLKLIFEKNFTKALELYDKTFSDGKGNYRQGYTAPERVGAGAQFTFPKNDDKAPMDFLRDFAKQNNTDLYTVRNGQGQVIAQIDKGEVKLFNGAGGFDPLTEGSKLPDKGMDNEAYKEMMTLKTQIAIESLPPLLPPSNSQTDEHVKEQAVATVPPGPKKETKELTQEQTPAQEEEKDENMNLT